MKKEALLILTILLFISGCSDYFPTIDSCNSYCISSGYESGNCIFASEAKENMIKNGKCYIKSSDKCSEKDRCFCYCALKEEEAPEGSIKISELLEDRVYNEEITLYGTVSVLHETIWPIFHLTSGKQSVEVWYDDMINEITEKEMPSINVSDLKNGDKVIVTCELKPLPGKTLSNIVWSKDIKEITD